MHPTGIATLQPRDPQTFVLISLRVCTSLTKKTQYTPTPERNPHTPTKLLLLAAATVSLVAVRRGISQTLRKRLPPFLPPRNRTCLDFVSHEPPMPTAHGCGAVFGGSKADSRLEGLRAEPGFLSVKTSNHLCYSCTQVSLRFRR